MDIQTILLNLKIDQLNAMQEASIDAWKEGSDLILLSPCLLYTSDAADEL